ncbi:YrzI family small protein [Litchfieldia alkalitelluris]|nr:YrzI family small protein [Litchfieldia alkalitelluris]
MNLNLFFLTITIKKRNVPMEEYVHEENVQRMYEQMKERQYTMINNY